MSRKLALPSSRIHGRRTQAFTGVLDTSGEPGLKAWFARMEATKGVQALKGKGKSLWPGDNQKPW